MITETLYQTYLSSLLNGDKNKCLNIVKTLLEDNIEIRDLYVELFQKSMYKVGEMWERNEISVAREHLATLTTESLLSLTYPYTFAGDRKGKNAIISCAANEYHQLGSKMVADIFELHGWDTYFLGANTPATELVRLIDEMRPDLVGLSLAVYFNIPSLKKTLEAIKADFSTLDVLVGGHAFAYGGTKLLATYSGTTYFESLTQLEGSL